MCWNDVIPTHGLRLEDCKFEISLNNLVRPCSQNNPTSASVVPHFRCGTGNTSCLRSWASSQHSQYPLGTCFVPKKSGASLEDRSSGDSNVSQAVSGSSGVPPRSSHNQGFIQQAVNVIGSWSSGLPSESLLDFLCCGHIPIHVIWLLIRAS